MMIRTSLIAFMIGTGLFWLCQLEPDRVVIMGDGIEPVRFERPYAAALRSASSLPSSTTAIAATAATGPYMQTVAVPCTPSIATGGICYTTIPVSR